MLYKLKMLMLGYINAERIITAIVWASVTSTIALAVIWSSLRLPVVMLYMGAALGGWLPIRIRIEVVKGLFRRIRPQPSLRPSEQRRFRLKISLVAAQVSGLVAFMLLTTYECASILIGSHQHTLYAAIGLGLLVFCYATFKFARTFGTRTLTLVRQIFIKELLYVAVVCVALLALLYVGWRKWPSVVYLAVIGITALALLAAGVALKDWIGSRSWLVRWRFRRQLVANAHAHLDK